jgi:hypothetical protein
VRGMPSSYYRFSNLIISVRSCFRPFSGAMSDSMSPLSGLLSGLGTFFPGAYAAWLHDVAPPGQIIHRLRHGNGWPVGPKGGGEGKNGLFLGGVTITRALPFAGRTIGPSARR